MKINNFIDPEMNCGVSFLCLAARHNFPFWDSFWDSHTDHAVNTCLHMTWHRTLAKLSRSETLVVFLLTHKFQYILNCDESAPFVDSKNINWIWHDTTTVAWNICASQWKGHFLSFWLLVKIDTIKIGTLEIDFHSQRSLPGEQQDP